MTFWPLSLGGNWQSRLVFAAAPCVAHRYAVVSEPIRAHSAVNLVFERPAQQRNGRRTYFEGTLQYFLPHLKF